MTTSNQDPGAYVPLEQNTYGAHSFTPDAVVGYSTGSEPVGDADSSVKDVAKDQAASVAGGASDAAQHVAGVAKEQAGQVTAEAGRQVKQLVGQAQSELSSQAQTQQQRAASGLRSVGEQLSSMAQGSEQSGVATDLAAQAADRVHQIAGWLENRDPASVLEEVRVFARRRPGAFLAIALGAGVLAGRVARGLAAPDKAAPAAGQPVRPAVGTTPGAALPSTTTPAPDLPPTLDGDLYGTGLVPDWTGKTADELAGDR